jgi:predicted peptidase
MRGSDIRYNLKMDIDPGLMTTILCVALLLLPVIVILPFIYLGRSSMKKDGISQHILKPGPRRYTISIPDDYSKAKAVPVVVALHYGGHGAPHYGRFFLTEIVKPALDELDAIIIAPDCPAKDWLQPESENFVFDLLDHIRTDYNIDPNRILVTGFSLGGMGTWHFAGRFPDRFTAAIVMAGLPPDDALDLDWSVPLYVIQGRADELMPLTETTRAVARLEERDFPLKYQILERVTHFETHKFVKPLQATIPWLREIWRE